MNYGFVKVATAIPEVRVADCKVNANNIINQIKAAEEQGVELLSMPEMCITSYSIGDLIFSDTLMNNAEEALSIILTETITSNVIVVVGMPVSYRNALFNCAVVINKGKVLGVVPKSHLAEGYGNNEKRWFVSGKSLLNDTVRLCGQVADFGTHLLFDTGSFCFGVEIGEDLFATNSLSDEMTLFGAEVIVNISAMSESIGKYEYIKSLLKVQSGKLHCGYIYSDCGYGESTSYAVFGGKSIIYENGQLLGEAERFELSPQLLVSEIDIEKLKSERQRNNIFCEESLAISEKDKYKVIDIKQSIINDDTFILTRTIEKYPFVPQGIELSKRCDEIFSIQVLGLVKRVQHTNCDTVVIGISGGLDSTLALIVTIAAFDAMKKDRRNIIGITMPGFGTTQRTYVNATDLMKNLGITIREISITDACKLHFNELAIDESKHDVTYENAQARERTQILMDAANQMNGIVVGTGDLSELALGWATYNGDHMSMYGVNASVPKTLIRHLVVWAAENIVDEPCAKILSDIVNTPISPELLPADEEDNITQKTEDLVGPYELHDFFLYYFMRFGYSKRKILFLAKQAFKDDYSEEIIVKWLDIFMHRFVSQQYKRNCMPDGPKVGTCCLSPHGEWVMPSDSACFL